MGACLLMTGAGGIVGSELARVLATDPQGPRLVLLLRGTPDEFEAKKRWLSDWIGPGLRNDRVRFVRGDTGEPELGLEGGVRAELLSSVTGILHAAAGTSFHQTEEQGHASNVVGTRRVLAFAEECPKLDRFGLISTLYVAGKRTGDIEESEVDLNAGFSNEYERSKAIAEDEAMRSGLPVASFRFGLVVGRRTDGRISRMTGVYPVWRIFHQGLLSLLPGRPDQPIDLVPADFAAEATAYLMLHAFEPGARYHVSAGAERSFDISEMFPFVAASFGRVDPAWERHGYPMPASLDHAAFESFADTVELVAHVSLRGVVRQMRVFSRQLEFPKRFSTRRFDAALAASPLSMGHARTWLGPVVEHACREGFRAPAQGWEVTHAAG